MTSEHSEQATGGGEGRNERGPLTLGLQRVLGVRILLGDHGAVNEAIGVLRRRPVVQRISMTTAAELVARGAPLAVRRAAPAPSPAPEPDADAIAEGR